MSLETWRSEIRSIDESILALVAQRMSFAKKIGLLKAEEGLSIHDAKVETQILSHLCAKGEGLDLSPDFVREFMAVIMRHSAELQAKEVYPKNSK